MKISFLERSTTTSLPKAESLVLVIGEDLKLTGSAATVDKKVKGAVAKAIKTSRFKGKKGQYFTIAAPSGIEADRIVLAGIGKAGEADALAYQSLGGGLVPALNSHGAKYATLLLDLAKKTGSVTPAEAAAQIAYGARLRSYRFDKYKTKEKPEDKPTFSQFAVALKGSSAANNLFKRLEKVADGVFFTRNLVSEPSNIINPETLAEACKGLSKLGIDVEVLDEKQMKKLGMNALLGVGKGSEYESKLVVMRWDGADKKGKASAPLAFVGKGVTFDTGGISLKPAGGMDEMKWDMGGSATVIGLMYTLAARKAKVNAVGVVGLVENMPDGNAQKPGDVVTSMSGQTIEVLNTDAEGRLVLADALWYTQEKYKPRFVIDLATLTGAIVVALGTSRAGIFSNDDKLCEQLSKAAKSSGEDVWRMPLADVYDKQINSPIADMQNIGGKREAGSITAAQFLKRFIKDKMPWVHIDIAGVAWSDSDRPTCPKGGTAYGVQLLDTLIAENYEK